LCICKNDRNKAQYKQDNGGFGAFGDDLFGGSIDHEDEDKK
jgi:hypothetical protein